MSLDEDDGATPLDPDEAQDLLIELRTRGALNRAEEENILAARQWAAESKLVRQELLDEKTLRRVHREMFGAIWAWAGRYRKTGKNIGAPAHQIPTLMHQLCGDFVYRLENTKVDRDPFAVEFHHRLVMIHPFSNGNGRHARFCADRLVENLGGEAFPWGRSDIGQPGQARARYLEALRVADQGDLKPLVAFARSTS